MPKRSKSSQAPLSVESKRVVTDFVPIGLRSAPGAKRKRAPDGVDFSVRGHPPIRIHWDTILKAGADSAFARRLVLSLIQAQVGYVPINLDAEVRTFTDACRRQVAIPESRRDREGSILNSKAFEYLDLFLSERIDDVRREHGFKPKFDLAGRLELAFRDFFVHRAMPDELPPKAEREELTEIADASDRLHEVMLSASPHALERAEIPMGDRSSLVKRLQVIRTRAHGADVPARKGRPAHAQSTKELIDSLVLIHREGTGIRTRGTTDARQYARKRHEGPLMKFIVEIFKQVDEATEKEKDTKRGSLGYLVNQRLKVLFPNGDKKEPS